MVTIKTLNAISDVIYDILPEGEYKISDSAENPDALLVRSAKCLDMQFDPHTRAIARAGAGVNNIPVTRCAEEGIVVFNTPGANANAVKELVFASLLMSSRHVYEGVAWCNSLKGKGDQIPELVEAGKKQFVGHEIKEKTLGVIGLGAIGVMVANEGYAMGLKVIGCDPYISVEHAWKLSRAVRRADSLAYLLAQSDYISLHIPLMKETRGYIGKEQLALMKPSATLLNFARGELVDTDALMGALKQNKISKYVTDFPSEALLGVPDVLCIPHLGASTPESEENCASMAARQLHNFLTEGNIKNSVNFPDCEMERSGAMRICIINRNTPNMIGQFTQLLSNRHANITNMINRSQNDYAYTMIDVDEKLNENLCRDLMAIEGVVRVTVL